MTSFPPSFQLPARRDDPLGAVFIFPQLLFFSQSHKALATAGEFLQFKDAQHCPLYYSCLLALCCCHDNVSLESEQFVLICVA